MSVKMAFELDSVQKILLRRGLNKNGKCQQFFSKEIKRLSDPYVPFGHGELKNIVDVGPDYVHYQSPYAQVHWYGKVMAGSPPKYPTDRDMQYNGAPKRGPHWVSRMWIDRGGEIVKSVAQMAGGSASK